SGSPLAPPAFGPTAGNEQDRVAVLRHICGPAPRYPQPLAPRGFPAAGWDFSSRAPEGADPQRRRGTVGRSLSLRERDFPPAVPYPVERGGANGGYPTRSRRSPRSFSRPRRYATTDCFAPPPPRTADLYSSTSPVFRSRAMAAFRP